MFLSIKLPHHAAPVLTRAAVVLAIVAAQATIETPAKSQVLDPSTAAALADLKAKHSATVSAVRQILTQVDSMIEGLQKAAAADPNDVETRELLDSAQKKRQSIVQMLSALEKSDPGRMQDELK